MGETATLLAITEHPFVTIDVCVRLPLTFVGVGETLYLIMWRLCPTFVTAFWQESRWSSVVVGNILVGVNVRYVPYPLVTSCAELRIPSGVAVPVVVHAVASKNP